MKSLSSPAYQGLSPGYMAASLPYFWLWVGLAAHIPLAYLMRLSPSVATIHALLIFAIGLYFIISEETPYKLVFLTGYIVGADVLWRMTKAMVFWEFGKYALSFLLLLALLRWRPKIKLLPLWYFLLLLPAIFLTVAEVSLWRARSQISFNLSGPFSLAIAGLFFSGLTLNRDHLTKLMLYAIMPILGIAFLAFFKTYTASHLDFTSQSSAVTSGGFGANQVSAMLGLGALLCWLCLLRQEKFSLSYWLLAGLMIFFLGQALLTFSRGGVFNFLAAVLLSLPFLLSGQKRLLGAIFFVVLISGFFTFVVLPRLDDFTGGKMADRFSDTGTTGRWEIVQKDVQLWLDNFLLGVGPGMSATLRGGQTTLQQVITSSDHANAAHTEYSRLLAEHGLFGLLAMILLFLMALKTFWQAPSAPAKGLTAAFMGWSLILMLHAAMRLAAISYFYALPFATLEVEDDK